FLSLVGARHYPGMGSLAHGSHRAPFAMATAPTRRTPLRNRPPRNRRAADILHRPSPPPAPRIARAKPRRAMSGGVKMTLRSCMAPLNVRIAGTTLQAQVARWSNPDGIDERHSAGVLYRVRRR